MSMMVRVLSVLPFATGTLCLLLVLGSLFGFASGTIVDEATALPCVGTPQDECATGMSESDLEVPSAFFLLDVQLEISIELEEQAWIGVVDADHARTCPPDETGLTECTAGDYTFLAGGPDSSGTVKHSLEPGELRFVTGGHEGSTTLDDGSVTTEWSVHLATWFSILLAFVGIGLCVSGLHMAFPMVANIRKA
jgi:hypothetical protein